MRKLAKLIINFSSELLANFLPFYLTTKSCENYLKCLSCAQVSPDRPINERITQAFVE